MMNTVTKSCLLSIMLLTFVVNADSNTSSQSKGGAVIKVAGKTYTLSLKKCYSATQLFEGENLTAFIITTHLSRKSKEPGPRFSATGSKTGKTGYQLQIDGGFSKGGTLYQGKMPYESFKDKRLIYSGKADSYTRVNKKPVKELVPINITVSCN